MVVVVEMVVASAAAALMLTASSPHAPSHSSRENIMKSRGEGRSVVTSTIQKNRKVWAVLMRCSAKLLTRNVEAKCASSCE